MSWCWIISRSTNSPRCRRRSKRVGARLRFLPPYSPDLNPIELAFAKLKAFLRAARPRSFDQVVELVAIAIGLFTPQECLNFVRHCGYRVYGVMKNALAEQSKRGEHLLAMLAKRCQPVHVSSGRHVNELVRGQLLA